jgi:threonine dehydratase
VPGAALDCGPMRTDSSFTLDELAAAADLVHATLPATPQHRWPLLAERLGCDVVVKHENHTPLGAFKIRGAVTYADWLKRSQPEVTGVICATRGNHGQAVAFAAGRNGLTADIVVPRGNSVEKNAAMRALGGRLTEHGEDFQAALEFAQAEGRRRGLHPMPSYHRELVRGVATAGLELLSAHPEITRVYVPIGLGSGINGMIAARAALGHQAEIVGVVSAHAPAYQISFQSGQLAVAPVSTKLADGLACSTPDAQALEAIWRHVARIVSVSDAEVAEAMRLFFSATHNVAEGAAAATLAAALQEPRAPGDCVALVLSGGNVDRGLYARVLAGEAFD